MYPDFLSIFGIRLYGIEFERILWLLGSLLMLWGAVNSVLLLRGRKIAEGIIQGGIVLAILAWFGHKLYSATIGAANYQLFFSEEIEIHSYAVCILIGVILAVWLATRSATRDGLSAGSIFNLCLVLLLAGFFGARLAHVLGSAPEYINACIAPEKVGLVQSDCWRFFKFSEGGLTFYGGVIAGIVVLFFYRRFRAVPVLQIMDVLAPSLAIAHAFGRIGCLSAGCCWGAVTSGPFGLIFAADSFAYASLSHSHPQQYAAELAAGHTPLLHATQLYEVFGELVLFFILITLLAKRRRFGHVFSAWLILYGVMRFFTEFMRGDFERGYLFEAKISWLNNALALPAEHPTIMSTSQVIAVVMITLGLFIALRRVKNESARQEKESVETQEKAVT
ncbi:MAG: prolipoprotein diacylglyceryl transferase [Bradymonadales bacterium]|jgi:phosphatidylglycerol:prolipoprotein diacylglycerol transferase